MKGEKFYLLLMSVVLIASMLATSVSAGSVFPDVEDNARYAQDVELTKQLGLLKGDNKGNFNPDSGITRAEFAAVVCRMMDGEESAKTFTDSGFSDVPKGHWATGYIAWAVKQGIVGGYGNGKYGPSDQVKYEQAIKMMVCAINMGDVALDAGGYPNGYITAAKSIHLLDNVEGSVGKTITRANIAVLVSNIERSDRLR